MTEKPKITIIGGGSYSWAPQFIRDIAVTPELDGSRIVLQDINPAALDLVYALGQRVLDLAGSRTTLSKTTSLTEALPGSDFVILTITTGGLEAMRNDLEIPEKFGIFQSVGDTVGPGGWARGLRNIPVVLEIARQIEALAPQAWLLNYTNPMSVLCRAITRETRVKTIGLCHEYHGVRRHLAELFSVDESQIQSRVGGINHLTWILDLQIAGQDGFTEFARLAERILADDLPVDADDGSSFADHFKVKARLFQIYGALPAAGDRHLAEFFPFFLSESAGRGADFGVVRTPISERAQIAHLTKTYLEALLAGDLPLEPQLKETSGEAANQIIAALCGGAPYIGPLNLPNQGQISNLPADVIVETFGRVDATGATPLTLGPLPPGIRSVIQMHVDNQEMIVEAALKGDLDLAFRALVNDPLVTDLPNAAAMFTELRAANQSFYL